jgi:predicted N-formylglutamate amidohydrolase
MRVQRLLSDHDPDPVFAKAGRSDWLLTVEHAGRAIPSVLGDLGLPPGEIDRHIGWDPGALDLALELAHRLDASLIAQRYSRLVIDCNRPWQAHDLVPETSDRTAIPANKTGREDHKMRWDEIHAPFHAAVTDALDRGARRLVAVHTYDPLRRVDGATRPWPIGLLARVSNPLIIALERHLSEVIRVAPLGVNQPYEIEDTSDYTIPIHAEPRDLPHVLIEVRNDFLRDAAAVAAMADTIFEACRTLEPA